MSASYSSALRAAMMATGSFKSQMDGSFIDVYAGAIPANADAAIGGATLLLTISVASGATGITFDTSAPGGVLAKNTSEVWSGVVSTAGTASFFRLRKTGDTGASSTTSLRLQGSVGVAGADMNLTSNVLANGATQTLSSAAFYLPEA